MKALSLLALGLVASLALAVSGCASVPSEADIPMDKTAAELTQLAQTSYDNGNVAAARVYYQTIIHRYADDAPARIAAQFEIAHLLIKKHKWDDAFPLLQAIIAEYDDDKAYALPRAYYKLAQLDMDKIPESHKKDR